MPNKSMPTGLRGKQLDRMIKEAEDLGTAKDAPAGATSTPGRTMSQAEFSGYDKPRVKTAPPKEMLDRLDRTPYNFDKSATDKKGGRYGQ